jgi:energy-coupling factor transporter ATP-binding protein EcfA2
MGAITTLLGRNGGGKTTTLRSLMGLTPPREGVSNPSCAQAHRQPSDRTSLQARDGSGTQSGNGGLQLSRAAGRGRDCENAFRCRSPL